jgi:hypothetical protein
MLQNLPRLVGDQAEQMPVVWKLAQSLKRK